MAEIKFKANYGYAPASPLWAFIRDGEDVLGGTFQSKDEAEEGAGVMAQQFPGCPVHVLAVVATVQTSPDIVGERFDPSKTAPRLAPEPEQIPEAPAAVAVDEEEPI
jgi:hypothetical protein